MGFPKEKLHCPCIFLSFILFVVGFPINLYFWFVFLVFPKKKLHSLYIFIEFILLFVGVLIHVFFGVRFLGFYVGRSYIPAIFQKIHTTSRRISK